MKAYILFTSLLLNAHTLLAQSVSKTMKRLPDTGQISGYTNTFGEDNDYTINAPFFTVNGNGTVTDTITGLMWQQTDGGEMTIENATTYCSTLNLGGYTNWRLPTAHEAFSILNHQNSNPALNTTIFTTSLAGYWWTKDKQVGDTTKIWCTNSGGGIGNHPKIETLSAGGIKRFHVRAVRSVNTATLISNHFTTNSNGTVTDNLTNLTWQKVIYFDTLTWEKALTYADTLTTGGYTDWRLPNIKELQSINEETLTNPSLNTTYFTTGGIQNYWSSTTLPNQTTRAWYLDTHFGITTYDIKTLRHSVICTRGNLSSTNAIAKNNITTEDKFVYPNPFHSTITIKSKTGNEVFELYSYLGKLIFSGNAIELHDFSSLPVGVYVLKSSVGNISSYSKLIKE
jgi:hypothetical protein